MLSLTAQIEQRRRSETQQLLLDARDAALGYAASHSALTDGRPYFPCPDTDGDGIGNRTGNTCSSAHGRLPWVDLGLANMDAWSNRFSYSVHSNFSNNDTGISLQTAPSDFTVCEQAAAACAAKIATQIPLVIISHGPNGFGATNANNGVNPAPLGADEIENTNADTFFVSHTPVQGGANEFDDQLVWLSPNIIFNRLIAAGRLP